MTPPEKLNNRTPKLKEKIYAKTHRTGTTGNPPLY